MWQGVMSEEIIQLDTEDSQLLFKPSSKLLQLIVCDLAWASLPKSDPRFNWQIRDALRRPWTLPKSPELRNSLTQTVANRPRADRRGFLLPT